MIECQIDKAGFLIPLVACIHDCDGGGSECFTSSVMYHVPQDERPLLN